MAFITFFSVMNASTLRRPPQGQLRTSSRKTLRSRGRNDLASPTRGGAEHAVVADQVMSRRGHERGEATEKFVGLEDEGLPTVGERALQAKREAAVG